MFVLYVMLSIITVLVVLLAIFIFIVLALTQCEEPVIALALIVVIVIAGACGAGAQHIEDKNTTTKTEIITMEVIKTDIVAKSNGSVSYCLFVTNGEDSYLVNVAETAYATINVGDLVPIEVASTFVFGDLTTTKVKLGEITKEVN